MGHEDRNELELEIRCVGVRRLEGVMWSWAELSQFLDQA
jgi:hypothetical protein